jgi:hypothetical protein
MKILSLSIATIMIMLSVIFIQAVHIQAKSISTTYG